MATSWGGSGYARRQKAVVAAFVVLAGMVATTGQKRRLTGDAS